VSATGFILLAIISILLVGIGILLKMAFSSPNGETARIANLMGVNAKSSELKPDLYKYKGKQVKTKLTLEEVQLKLLESKGKAINVNDPEVLFFRAGYFSTAERVKFLRLKKFMKVAFPLAISVMLWALSGEIIYAILGAACGYMIGRVAPDHLLGKRIKRRAEDSLYFLPLVIEQISIGVSSSLDIGPCVSYVVEMADERSSHNVVTEILSQVLKLMKAGMSLDEALTDVGEVIGIHEIKNAFMFLAQCSKHGGEISKQLTDLAESVTLSRQLDIEARIVALPTKASGALGLIFFGFFIMLLAGLFVKISSALSF